MNLLEIIILAIVQGLTEFLPVSSSGHLVVVAAVLESLGREKLPDLLEVEIVLHLGTLLAVMVFYWQRVRRLIGGDRRVIPLLVVGSIPAVLVGLPLKYFAEDLLNSPLLAGLMFPVTASLLIWASRRQPGGQDYVDMNWHQALLIGIFQAVAILPGISRSGATIVAGLAIGMNRKSSATFAFLLAIPAIAGAGVLGLKDVLGSGTFTTPPGVLLLGASISFLVGLFSLWWLIRLVESGRLAVFAYWLIPLGVAVTLWQVSLLIAS